MRILLATLFATALALISSPSALASEKPNIIFILADDMGYGDVRALNPKSQIPTPNLDRLAADGMAFTDAHSGSAVCTPTRYGVLTGRYCWRTRLKSGVLNGYGEPLIEAYCLTVAGMLGEAGLSHRGGRQVAPRLGFAKGEGGRGVDLTKPVEPNPNSYGFDHSFIIPASLDFPPYVFVENGRVTDPETVAQSAQKFPAFLRNGPRSKALTMETCLHDLLGEAQRFVRESAKGENPFFLYFPLTAPHKPVLPHPDFRGRTKLGPYGDFVAQVDWTVGELMRTLEEFGAAENTAVFYTSDNGSFMFRRDGEDHVDDASIQAFRPEHHTANGELRGTKADVWEGGHRVPFLVRWPGKIAPGSRCGEPICHVDFMATAAAIAGAKLPDDSAEDSFDLAPLLANEGEFQRAPVINHSASGMFAIRDGRWKLVAGNGSGGRESPKGKPFAKPYELYDLSADLGEAKNVIAENPEVAAKLESALEKIRGSGRSR
ncbi:MAG: arylsulfatase [Verrucomicrobiales bacterium]